MISPGVELKPVCLTRPKIGPMPPPWRRYGKIAGFEILVWTFGPADTPYILVEIPKTAPGRS